MYCLTIVDIDDLSIDCCGGGGGGRSTYGTIGSRSAAEAARKAMSEEAECKSRW